MPSVHPEIWHISHMELTLRLLLAALLGGLIGLEREWNNHAAGFRTHILVTIGAAGIMLLSIYGFADFVYEANVRTDPARLAAQVISGIGFLGAGAIMRNGSTVSGLTTAASIWVVAAIGLCVGAGFYYVSVLATALVLVSLFLLNKWEKHLLRHRRACEVEIRMKDRAGNMTQITAQFETHGVQIRNLKMHMDEPASSGDKEVMNLKLSLQTANPEKMLKILQQISGLPGVLTVESRQLELSGRKGAAERLQTFHS